MGRNKSLNLYAGRCFACGEWVESEQGFRVNFPTTHIDKRIAGKGWHTECAKCNKERNVRLNSHD